MGAIIEAIATRTGDFAAGPASSVDLASDAGREALSRAGRSASEIGLLVNVGVYRDEHIVEPAMAPLIQRRLEQQAPGNAPHSAAAFSFDVSNGTCGFLTGIEIVSGFVSSGAFERGLVVTSDVNASPNVCAELTCAPIGGAVLLRRGCPEEGFTAFATATNSKYSDRYEAVCRWLPEDQRVETAPSEGHVLRVHQGEDYATLCAREADRSLTRFLDQHGLSLHDIDLIVPSESPVGFCQAFAAEVKPAVRSRCAEITACVPGVHTVGPAMAIESALASERGREAWNLLFIAAGSGITVALALYRRPLLDDSSSPKP